MPLLLRSKSLTESTNHFMKSVRHRSMCFLGGAARPPHPGVMSLLPVTAMSDANSTSIAALIASVPAQHLATLAPRAGV
jgi:hypothetical protein